MKKIKISADYDTSENLVKRLLYQFKTCEDDVSNIEFVYDDSYDIIVFFNNINCEIKKGSKSYVFPHEPSWVGTHQKGYHNHLETTVFGFNNETYTPQEVCDKSKSYTFYGGRGPWVDKEEDWNYEKLSSYEILKTKNISSVITRLNSEDIRPEGCSYKYRHELNEFLSENAKFIDFYSGWGNISDPYKKSAVKDYRFSIAVENQFTENWITEKFFDSILYNTIPIYFGCTNIKELYPELGYFVFEDITNHQKCLELINEIENNSEELYKKMLPELLKIKEKYFKSHNLLKKINNL